jgi:predicted XRE-type DNA-binding protein
MNIEHTTPANGNVFADIGFSPVEAANLLIRAQLMSELTDILKARYATQTEAAEVLDVTQTRVSDLYRGKIERFTVDMLVNLLSRVGQVVEVHTRKAA